MQPSASVSPAQALLHAARCGWRICAPSDPLPNAKGTCRAAQIFGQCCSCGAVPPAPDLGKDSALFLVGYRWAPLFKHSQETQRTASQRTQAVTSGQRPGARAVRTYLAVLHLPRRIDAAAGGVPVGNASGRDKLSGARPAQALGVPLEARARQGGVSLVGVGPSQAQQPRPRVRRRRWLSALVRAWAPPGGGWLALCDRHATAAG